MTNGFTPHTTAIQRVTKRWCHSTCSVGCPVSLAVASWQKTYPWQLVQLMLAAEQLIVLLLRAAGHPCGWPLHNCSSKHTLVPSCHWSRSVSAIVTAAAFIPACCELAFTRTLRVRGMAGVNAFCRTAAAGKLFSRHFLWPGVVHRRRQRGRPATDRPAGTSSLQLCVHAASERHSA